MQKDKDEKTGGASGHIEEILRERERLEQVLREKFKREVTILFSDICGYTKHMDTRGDISGRAMLQRHNDIVLPVVEKHEGTVIKTIGDAVMASFPTALDAVKASVGIQQGLEKHNQQADSADKVQVKIGVNTGEALVDNDDVYGDVVNVASRIQSEAQADQILISTSVYNEVRGSEDILCRWHGEATVKGKAQPLELYRVAWRDEDFLTDVEPTIRSYEATATRKAQEPMRVLLLEAAREGDRVRISAHEQMAGEASTIRHYEEMSVSMDWLSSRCREMVETLNKVNRKGRLSGEILVKLREVGQVFYDELFPLGIKGKLKETKAEFLSLHLDDQLVHVPWELLHDGRQFLCQRFAMGRLVKTRQRVPGVKSRALARPLKALVLADPKGDLKGAYAEGKNIRNYMEHSSDFVNVTFCSENITPDFIKEKTRNFDFVHYAGHADYDPEDPGQSGWRLSEGMLKAKDILKMAGSAAMPALIFSNACQSARTEGWAIKEHFQDEIFGLANAFLLSGVKHYVGTFWEILDEPSSHFALEFYKQLLCGQSVGEAVRQARIALIKSYGEETIVWASYLLYGDPTFNYMDQIEIVEPHVDEPVRVAAAEPHVRAHEEVIDFAEQERSGKKRNWWGFAVGAIALVAVLLWVWPGFMRQGAEKFEQVALAHYKNGRFEEALSVCGALKEKRPGVRLAYLIPGNIFLSQGNLEAAEASFEKAVKAPKGTDMQKAKALRGLGRIASLQNEPDEALRYYSMATEAAPKAGIGYVSQALVLEDRGDYDASLSLLEKAQKVAPGNTVVAAMTKETRKRVALAHDKEKQGRVDQLVQDLLETVKAPPVASPSDGWTSPPLTLWLLDFTVQGNSLGEGEERMLAAGITDQLVQHSRAQVVERALLDQLLEELKLGTSQLADRHTALSLGRILAARVMVSGQLVFAGPETQVSLRLIETETGRVSGAMNESFGSAMPVSMLSEKLSRQLIKKLEALYPLRGRVAEVAGEQVRINIGQKAGVQVGQRFKVLDQDITLEVVSAEQETSLTRIAAGEGELTAALRVEAL